jgi:hypothetical protein
MCDALSRNFPKLPKPLEIMVGNCNAHARRRFVDVIPSFPEKCRYVLENLGKVYGYDAQAEEQGLSAEERLRFHQAYSGPIMNELHSWLRAQFEKKEVGPNSGMGTAINYALRHWDRLTPFLRQPSAPLDSNIVERALKRAILHRNYVHLSVTWRCTGEGSRSRMKCCDAEHGSEHNHRLSRKASRRSLGLNLRLFPVGMAILSIALFFIVKSASTYM